MRPSDDADAPLRLRLQRLERPLQVLAIGALAEARGAGTDFATAEVADLYTKFKIPRPGNLSDSLGRLMRQGLLVRPRKNTWALTPEGHERLRVSWRVSPADLSMELADSPSATLGEQSVTIVPAFLAPHSIQPGVDRLLQKSDFDSNIMLITRFPKSEQDVFAELISVLRSLCADYGLNLLLASDGNAEDTLWANVVAYMWGCKYAIVLVDVLDGVFNSNVLIEVGGMLMTGRRCAILRDKSVPSMPTDLVGHIYREVHFSDTATVTEAARRFIEDDLALGTA